MTNAPSGFTLDPHSGILRATATTLQVGTHVVTITASNGIGVPASQTFSIVVAPSSTCTTTWTGADGSSNWSDPANWNAGAVPGATDWACIPATAPGLPVQVSDNATAAAISDDGGLSIVGALILTGDQPSTTAGGLFVSGTLAVTGAPELSGTIRVTNGTLKGPGTLTIASGSNLTVTSSGGSAPRLYSGLRLVNNGTLTVTAGTQFNLFPGEVVENAGTLSLGNGASLMTDYGNWGDTVPSVANNLVNDASGTISIPASASPPSIATNLLDQGVISVAGTLNLRATATLASTATFTGSGTIVDSGTLTPATSATLTGNFQLNNTTLQGPGTLTIAIGSNLTVTSSGGSAPRLYSGLRLVNNGTVTVTAGTQFNLFPGEVVENAGTLSLGNGASLMTDYGNWGDTVPSVANNLVNDASGTISIPSAASVKFNTKVFDAGTISNDGSLEFASVTHLAGSPAISGAGSVIVTGLLQIPAGVTADIANTLGGAGVIYLQGTSGFGLLNVTGGANVSKLTFEIGDSGYSPNCAASVVGISGSQVTGSWAAIATTGTPVAGGTWQPTITATSAGATLLC